MQAFLNTLDIESGRDTLADAEGLRTFEREHRLEELRLSERELPDVRRLREALRWACVLHAHPEAGDSPSDHAPADTPDGSDGPADGDHGPADEAEGPAEGLRRLERMLAGAPLTLTLDTTGHGTAPAGRTPAGTPPATVPPPRLRPAEGLVGVDALTARLAADIAVATAEGNWRRLKACQAWDCRWVFYDRSPAGRGRWCSMAVCGSRAKMRSYRSRRRG